MSDTPRTDALFASLHLPYNNDIPVEITIHAMNLERELSATKIALEKSKADAESWHQQAQQRLDDANEFGRKWEESQKELAQAKRELDTKPMNTPDKCPQCGAEIMEVGAKVDWTAYLCESYIGVHAKDDFSQSNYCRERAAHAATKRELESFRKENDVLRALLPKLGAPCMYCGLTEISKCERGFPGCPQADDLLCADETTHGDILKRFREAEAGVTRLQFDVENARADAESWQAKSERFEKQCLEADELRKELEKQVHFAAGFISCVPQFTHYHPEEVFRCIQRLGKPTLGEVMPEKDGI